MNSVKYVPSIMYISLDRYAVSGNIHNFGDIFYAIPSHLGVIYIIFHLSLESRNVIGPNGVT